MIRFADRAYPFADRVLALLAFASALKGVGRLEWQCGTTGRWRPPCTAIVAPFRSRVLQAPLPFA